LLYSHYDDISPRDWRAKYFSPPEIACRGTGEILVNDDLLLCLDKLRHQLGRPLKISSAYRSAYHNAQVGGAPRSCHRKGIAADLPLAGHDKSKLIELAKSVGFTGFGINYRTFIHIDMGRPRSW
jgi:zinc D-Ala-D-Ala carboxypeptidase